MATKKSTTPTKISELIPDDKNFNKGSEFGGSLISKSLQKFGAGRSILLDKNNRIIAGNKTVENAGAVGIEDVQVVETDGKTIIAVKRTDIDLDTPEGRELALADNASAKANIVFDAELIEAEVGEAVCQDWLGNEYQKGVKDEFGTDFTLPDGDKAPFQQMTFTLADEQAEQIKNAIADIKKTEEYKYAETMGNENSNGNALYLIVMQWAEQRK
jgi:hypothetical protein